ncbi:hypothetical protein RJ640_007937 [Escallonia rubra]|uniref:Aspartate/glutamate/uridylate kinase domain-containing protein n=1 Tax=Escallonia rubra TaxID=112253 RepID=A0AA88R645_9ASTE|nr:hypothetical protein RJ640_007937 [Escallonia rubra]
MRSSDTPPEWRRPKQRGGNQPWLGTAGGTTPSAIAQSFAATAGASTTFPNHSPVYQPRSLVAGETAPTPTIAQQFAATSDASVSFPSFTPSEMQRLADLLGRQSGPTNGPSANIASQNIFEVSSSWEDAGKFVASVEYFPRAAIKRSRRWPLILLKKSEVISGRHCRISKANYLNSPTGHLLDLLLGLDVTTLGDSRNPSVESIHFTFHCLFGCHYEWLPELAHIHVPCHLVANIIEKPDGGGGSSSPKELFHVMCPFLIRAIGRFFRYFDFDIEKVKKVFEDHKKAERSRGEKDDGYTFRFLDDVRHEMAGDMDVRKFWKPLIVTARKAMECEVDAFDRGVFAIPKSRKGGVSAIPKSVYIEAQKKIEKMASGKIFYNWSSLLQFAMEKFRGKSFRTSLSKLVFAVTCYSIWEERNLRIFTGKEAEKEEVMAKIDMWMKYRVLSGRRWVSDDLITTLFWSDWIDYTWDSVIHHAVFLPDFHHADQFSGHLHATYVLHGDAVLDNSQDCTILSGDVIVRHLAAELKPEFVVFLVSTVHPEICFTTDVSGVYDRPPTEPNAVLLREIVEITVAAHDTTGGMVTKISEAAMIAKLGIDVYIVKAATDHSLRALSGNLKVDMPEDWLGTVIRFVR